MEWSDTSKKGNKQMQKIKSSLRSDKYFETSQLLTHPKGNNQIVEKIRKGLRANLDFLSSSPHKIY